MPGTAYRTHTIQAIGVFLFAFSWLSSNAASGGHSSKAPSPPQRSSDPFPGRTDTEPAESASHSDTLRLFFIAETRGNLVPCRCPDRPWGGLGRRTSFLAHAAARPGALVVDAGGFLPEGDVPLRAEIASARRLVALLLDAARIAGVSAITMDPGQRQFVEHLAPREAAALSAAFLDATQPHELRHVRWGGFETAIFAVAETLPDSSIVSAAIRARKGADVVIVLARTSLGYPRIAELTGADVVVLSDGARPENPLRLGGSIIVGAGARGREVGELQLVVLPNAAEPRGVRFELAGYSLHPMDETVASHQTVTKDVRSLLDELGPGWDVLVTPTE